MKKSFSLSDLLVSFSSFGQGEIKLGMSEATDENGVIKYSSNYVNGILDGERVWYYESGEAKEREFYEDGAIIEN
jgi:antitoxin component YwqK of YwqJK toxin-antitoxin module